MKSHMTLETDTRRPILKSWALQALGLAALLHRDNGLETKDAPRPAWRSVSGLMGFAAVAVALSFAAAMHDRLPGDKVLAGWAQWFDKGWWNAAMRRIEWLGTVGHMDVLLLAVGVVLIARRRLGYAALVPMLAVTEVVVPIVKDLVDRPRPSALLVHVTHVESDPSFPSGHAFMAMIVFGCLFYLAGPLFGRRRWAARLFQGAMVLVIALAGFSRVYLGAHWPSDVLGGYLFGGIALLASILALEKIVLPQLSRLLSRARQTA